MYVCICGAVTDTQIKTACSSGPKTITELKQELGVAERCAKCTDEIKQIIAGGQSGSE